MTSKIVKPLYSAWIQEQGNHTRMSSAFETSNDVCVVCLESNEDPCTVYPCLHRFDRKCIKEWLIRKPCCPVCRTMTDKVLDSDSNEVWTPASFSILRRTPSPRFRRALALRRDQLEEATQQPSNSSSSQISETEVNLHCQRMLVEMAIHTTLVTLTEVLMKAVIFHLPNKRSFKS